jgi:glycosyltransferase involved in cell wall biosynthesis
MIEDVRPASVMCRVGRWPAITRIEVDTAAAGETAPATFGVVMPAHNAALTVLGSAGSVLINLGPGDHLAIVENGSKDTTWALLESTFGDDPRVRLDRVPRADAAAARNRAIGLLPAHDFIAFCDADDTWAPGRLTVLRAVAEITGADLMFHPAEIGTDRVFEGAMFSRKRLPRHPDLLTELLISGNFFATSTFALRSSATPLPLFAEGLTATQDFEAWCRFASAHRHPVVAYIEKPLATYRVHAAGLSAAAWRRQANVFNIIRAYSRAASWPARALALATATTRLAYHALLRGELAALPGVILNPPDESLFRGPCNPPCGRLTAP